MRKLMIATLAIWVVQSCFAQATRDNEVAIRSVIKQFENNWNERNAKAQASLFAPEGDQILFDRAVATGPTEIEQQWTILNPQFPKGRKISIAVNTVRFPLADIAVVNASATFTDGQDKTGKTLQPYRDRATYVFLKSEQAWKITALRVYPAMKSN